jgi:hypothetical protein
VVIALDSGFLITGFTVYAPITLSTNALTGGTNPTVYVLWNAPPHRTVYVKCTPDLNPSGIPSAALIASVTAAIYKNANQQANQPLGLTMDSLWVLPITVTNFYVTITSLLPGSSTAAIVMAAINTALTTYFAGLSPFIDGVDPAFGRNDLVTITSVSGVIQAVLKNYGASCASVAFGVAALSYLPSYQLGCGELGTFGGATYL